jgi:hypothetical protein
LQIAVAQALDLQLLVGAVTTSAFNEFNLNNKWKIK